MISKHVCALLLVCASLARGEELELICHQRTADAIPYDSADARKYAPSRDIHILHLALDVTPNFKERTIAAKAVLKFKPLVKALPELKLDAVDLNVSSVTSSAKVLGYQNTDTQIIVSFEPPIPPDQETTVTINYSAEPKQGLYFRTPEMGYKAEDTHFFTQGEATEARHWFPSYDHPNEKFTSEITCRVPEGMVVLSNGKLQSEERDAASGLTV